MSHSLPTLCCTLLLLLPALSSARAQDVHIHQHSPAQRQLYVAQPPPPGAGELVVVAPQPAPGVYDAPVEQRSVLTYSLQGLFAGALVGLSVGYIATADADTVTPWRGMVLATGIGALSGAGLGLGLGLLDAASDLRPLRFVMRDAAYGTLLGGAFGAAVGGLVALSSGDGTDALLGASIGGISGFVAGGLIGVLEGQVRARTVRVAIGLSPGARGERVPSATLSGRF